jgi:hypothetical protein
MKTKFLNDFADLLVGARHPLTSAQCDEPQHRLFQVATAFSNLEVSVEPPRCVSHIIFDVSKYSPTLREGERPRYVLPVDLTCPQ